MDAKVEDHTKQILLSQFSAWLDAAPDAGTMDAETVPDALAPTTDLYSLFVEMAGLRSEVRTESRLVKEALEQFRGVFETLQTSHAAVRQDLERARAETRDQAKAAIRPLLLDVIDLRDRLVAALTLSGAARTGWLDRVLRRSVTGGEAWQEGLRLTLRRLDQVLLDRGVVAMRLEGQPFDPLQARAVAIVADGTAPDGTVIEEVRAGFLWDDQVLRTAEVVVSQSDARKRRQTMTDEIVGIDLGTTNSEIAIYRNGRPEVLADARGRVILPSVVALSETGEMLVGEEARNQFLLYPERTIRSIKRRMGTDDTVRLGERDYRPQEISAIILSRLKEIAREALGMAGSAGGHHRAGVFLRRAAPGDARGWRNRRSGGRADHQRAHGSGAGL